MVNVEEVILKYIELKYVYVFFFIVVDVLGLEQFKLGYDNGGLQDYFRIM